jgi:hypothetical protein
MRRLLLAFAMATIVATPAFAQAQVPADQASTAEKKTKTKRVCENVREPATTGSRLGGGVSRVCRKVEVPVEDDAGDKAKAGSEAHAR